MWFAYEEEVDKWAALTELDENKRGLALKARLTGELQVRVGPRSISGRQRSRVPQEDIKASLCQGERPRVCVAFLAADELSTGQQRYEALAGQVGSG